MKFVYALIAVSLGVIAFGLYLIMQEQQNNQVPVTEPPRDLGLLPAPVPDEERGRPAVEPEIGSEAWCDMMMYKSSETWTEDETRTFADRCIYQD
ncbi:DUF3012 domain-containing protein [Marinimicrobium sp. ABcell2]|uniref:DUF3012 domain-containing protein n=1 Tax=Marinimicrobium sp. ABcell2 TaxID=3069751 RepID=UPI0027B1FE6D|nr:DUF3012 domain-containing protein [Marinimicrobium sp. ABcell2]MDQ2077834.1 DUF3012 domain-containing protein [Marinimicrobium sp. ABcell2]